MENPQLVNNSLRRKSRYTSCQYRTVQMPDGRAITLRLDIMVSVPMDAIMETTLSRVDLQARYDEPAPPPPPKKPRGRPPVEAQP